MHTLRDTFGLLIAYLRPHRGRAAWLALLLGGAIALQVANPQILRWFVDEALAGGPERGLLFAAALFLGVAVLEQLLTIAATVVSQQLGWQTTNALRLDLASHCLALDHSFHDRRQPGELIERIDGDVNVLFTFFSTLVIRVFGGLLLIVAVLAMLLREDWRVGLSLASFVLAALFVLMRLRRLAIPYWQEYREQSARFFGLAGELVAASEDIRGLGSTGEAMRSVFARMRDWYPIQRTAVLLSGSMWGTSLTFFALGNAVAFGVAGSLWREGVLTLGSVYLIFHYTELLRRPVEQIRMQLEQLQHAEASGARIAELFAIRSRLEAAGRAADGPHDGEALPDGALALSLTQVDFTYPHDAQSPDGSSGTLPHEPAIRGLSLALAAGRQLGVVGRTGSGKTTLARLVLRQADPQRGEVAIAGRPVRSLAAAELRRRVAAVTQQVEVFHASVRDNLRLFDPAVDDAALTRVLAELGLADWLADLPEGLDTLLGAGGVGLSAGEAQLLAMARVFLRDPGIVVLDEASSRLDPTTARRLERATARLLAGRTAVVIAHRLETLARVDEILVLEDGRMAEHGPRESLLRDATTRFRALLDADSPALPGGRGNTGEAAEGAS
jgi:ATP-binding cassette subfamily B protein